MTVLGAVFLGALAGIGLLTVGLGFQRKLPPEERARRRRETQGTRDEARKALAGNLSQIALAAALGLGGWYITGWPVMGLLGALAGFAGPRMFSAPKKRAAITDEIEAYSQWAEQIRDLVRASGSLFEAVGLSAENAPERLRPKVMNMTLLARTLGLPAALDWFAGEMRSPFADRLVLGMKIAWDSGARVSEAFESTARGMRAEVDMRRRNEVANRRAWTQVTSILLVTIIATGFMFLFNRDFFEPFGTTLGQGILLAAGLLILGNVFWVVKLSESGAPARLMSNDGARGTAGAPGPQAAEHP